MLTYHSHNRQKMENIAVVQYLMGFGCGALGLYQFPHSKDAAGFSHLKDNLHRLVKPGGVGIYLAVLNPDQRDACHETIIETGGEILAEFGNPQHDGRLLTVYGWLKSGRYGSDEELKSGKARFNETLREHYYKLWSFKEKPWVNDFLSRYTWPEESPPVPEPEPVPAKPKRTRTLKPKQPKGK